MKPIFEQTRGGAVLAPKNAWPKKINKRGYIWHSGVFEPMRWYFSHGASWNNLYNKHYNAVMETWIKMESGSRSLGLVQGRLGWLMLSKRLVNPAEPGYGAWSWAGEGSLPQFGKRGLLNLLHMLGSDIMVEISKENILVDGCFSAHRQLEIAVALDTSRKIIQELQNTIEEESDKANKKFAETSIVLLGAKEGSVAYLSQQANGRGGMFLASTGVNSIQ